MTPATDRENDQRPSVYREDGYWVIRASAFGKCPLALARIAAGMEGEPWPQTIRDAMYFGTANEPEIIRRVAAEGWIPWTAGELTGIGEVDGSGQLAAEITVGKVKVRVHPDGVVTNHAILPDPDGALIRDRALEVKCMAEGNDPQKGMYDWQFSIEMAATKMPLLLAIGWKEMDPKDGTRRLKDGVELREVDVAPHSIGEIKRRALMLGKMFDAAVEGRWEDVGECDETMYPCPFYTLHTGDKGEWQEIVDDRVDKIDEIARRIEADAIAVKELEQQIKRDKEALRVMVGAGFKGIAGGWKISITTTHVEASVREVKAHDRTVVKVERKKE